MLWVIFISIMKKMKLKIFFTFLLLLLPMSLFSRAHPLILQSKFETDTLFIQQASYATLKNNPVEPGKLQLILKGIYPRTIYITTSSKHSAGTISLHEFLRVWEDNAVQFEDSGPSAVMSYLSFKPFIQSGVQTDTLELTNPIYESSSNSIVFTATPQHRENVKTGRFKNVVIVYDGLNISSNEIKAHYKVMPSTIPNLLDKRSTYESY